MKRTRKLASLLLALVMVFALATTAFATEAGTTTTTGTITVDNPVAGQTYTAYKIFDVVYDDARVNYSYTIKGDSEWYNTVNGYATEANGLTLTPVADTTANTYVVTITDAFSAPKFAAALNAEVTGKTGKTLTKAESANTAAVSGLELGYYFVSSNTGALCNLTTTNPDVTIHDKNDMPFEKTADQTNVDVGQTVNYTVTGKVPDYTGFNAYTYKVADTMSEGLTFKKDVKVTVGGADVSTACTVAYDANGNANSFTVTIPVMNYQIGAEIKVTYSAVVNENAIAVVSKNNAKLIYSNDPTTDSTNESEPVIVNVYTSKIVIDKYETGKKTTKLPNAKFVLYKEETPGTPASAVYYKWNDTDKKVEWVTEMTAATVMTTNDQGEATFGGLADGTYHLVETEAPAGYNPLTAPVPVTVAGSSMDTTKLSVTAEVENKTGTTLPSTGGMGTTVFYVLGAVLVLGAVVLLVTKKRMSDANR